MHRILPTMEFDWGAGSYEETARQLYPAAVRALDLAAVRQGEHLLDLGCGNGNVSVAALGRGAVVTAVDPSPRLLDAARARVAALGAQARVLSGEGGRLELASASFDVVVAVFSVIFAPDAAGCVREMLRVTRPGGRLVITSWEPGGPVNEISELVRPPGVQRPPSPWLALEAIRELFAPYRVEVIGSREQLPLRASSAEAWLADLEVNHPYWRAMRQQRQADWPELRRRSVEVLEAANEHPAAFCVTSTYLVTRINVLS